MRYLPMSFDTKNKTVLVVGGGYIALERIERLLDSEFKIYVIASEFIEEIFKLSDKYSERILLKKSTIDSDFVFFGYDYLIIATHNFDLNHSLEERAKKSSIPYERCDIVSSSTLLMNKVISKEGLTVGITTNGINPTITDIVFEDISKLLATYNEEKILILNKIRRELVKKNALNIDDKIRKLYFEEKIKLDTYLDQLEESYKEDIQTTKKEEEKITEELNEKINEIKEEFNKTEEIKDNKENKKDAN